MSHFVNEGAKKYDKGIYTALGKNQCKDRKRREKMNIYPYIPDGKMFYKFQLFPTFFEYKLFAKSSSVMLLLKSPPEEKVITLVSLLS
jgi:hypothetical protein